MGRIILNGNQYGGGGGGGSADIVEVTLAEYIALGDVVNTDGKLYCITDLNNSDVQGYPPLIYSTDEREVGVWIDGNPLYEITIDQTINPTADYTVIASGVNHAHLVNSKCEYSSGLWVSPTYLSLSALSNAYSCYITVQNGVLNFHNQTNQSVHWIATIQYTKTTDTAGSGIWNGQGGYAHHYSTSEKVIGTWIDGKPLYEKTISCGALPNNTEKIVATLNDVKFLVETNGFAYNTNAVTNQRPLPFSAGGSNDIRVDLDVGSLRLVTFSNWSGYEAYITVRYTKTTD